MKIIITGATGTVGAALVRYFHSLGNTVIATGNNPIPPKRLTDYATYFQADICDPLEKFPNADAIIHCAALASDRAPWDELHQANVMGTRHVLDASAHIPIFIHISSSSVYKPSLQPLKEDHIPDDMNVVPTPYGKSKWMAEKEVLSDTIKRKKAILRPRAVYGPGDRIILPRVFTLKKGPFLFKPGNMKARCSMTHLTNLCFFTNLLLTDEKDWDGVRIYNITDPLPYKLNEVLPKLVKESYNKSLIEVNIPLFILSPIANILYMLKIKAELTPFVLNTFKYDQILDTGKAYTYAGNVTFTNFQNEFENTLKWIQEMGGPDELSKADPLLPWK
jgi:nucleoside-diphosphate-sugar epimerase